MSNFNLMEVWIDYQLYLYRNPSQPSTIPTEKPNKSLTCIAIILTKSLVSWFNHASNKKILYIYFQCCVKGGLFASKNWNYGWEMLSESDRQCDSFSVISGSMGFRPLYTKFRHVRRISTCRSWMLSKIRKIKYFYFNQVTQNSDSPAILEKRMHALFPSAFCQCFSSACIIVTIETGEEEAHRGLI